MDLIRSAGDKFSMNLFIAIGLSLIFVDVTISRQPPNIIIFLTDDLGINDISLYGSPEIPTPNIDAMAASGIILNNFYMGPVCTPSRASLMTGRYAMRTGIQSYVIIHGAQSALPLQFNTTADFIRSRGYATHMIGKWHIGHYRTEYLPHHRGFDTYFGHLLGLVDYYDHTVFQERAAAKVFRFTGDSDMWGVDLHDGDVVVKDRRGQYLPNLYCDRLMKVIKEHNHSRPLFTYFATNAPHFANRYMEIQVPPEYAAKFKYIKNKDRRDYAGMVATVDECLGRLFRSLDENNMLDNTIVMFASDNGAELRMPSSNYPLRGKKESLFEGGIRVPAILWSRLFDLKRPRIANQMMQVTDVLPTLYRAAGGNPRDLGYIDGINMWDTLITDCPSPRFKFVINVDQRVGLSGIRYGDYKLVEGSPLYKEGKETWDRPTEISKVPPGYRTLDEWVWKNGSTVMDIMKRHGWWLIGNKYDQWRTGLPIQCDDRPPPGTFVCNTTIAPCLFNIVMDPCEYWNLADVEPAIFNILKKELEFYKAVEVPIQATHIDSRADPRCHGFAITPWLDDDQISDCPYD